MILVPTPPREWRHSQIACGTPPGTCLREQPPKGLRQTTKKLRSGTFVHNGKRQGEACPFQQAIICREPRIPPVVTCAERFCRSRRGRNQIHLDNPPSNLGRHERMNDGAVFENSPNRLLAVPDPFPSLAH